MCDQYPSLQCRRCKRALPSKTVEEVVRRLGMQVGEVAPYEPRIMCDECSLASHRRARCLEVLLLGVLLVGTIALIVGRAVR